MYLPQEIETASRFTVCRCYTAAMIHMSSNVSLEQTLRILRARKELLRKQLRRHIELAKVLTEFRTTKEAHMAWDDVAELSHKLDSVENTIDHMEADLEIDALEIADESIGMREYDV